VQVKDNYPDSMKKPKPEVRKKAVEIANALLDKQTMKEGGSLPSQSTWIIAIAINMDYLHPDQPGQTMGRGQLMDIQLGNSAEG